MDFLPVFMRIRDRQVLVVGGGQVAFRKVQLLLKAGASVRLVAPELHASLEQLLGSGSHVLLRRHYDPADMDAVALVIAATDDSELNQAIYTQAMARQLPVNVVDQPALCSFIFPSIVDRSPLLVAVSSGGAMLRYWPDCCVRVWKP